MLDVALVWDKYPARDRVLAQGCMVLALMHSRLDIGLARVGRHLVGSSDRHMKMYEWDTAALEVEHAIHRTVHECYIAVLEAGHTIQQTTRG